MIGEVSWMSRKKMFLAGLWVNRAIFKTKLFTFWIAFDERRDSSYDPAKLSFGGAGKRPKRK